jgi:hypothetical protein
VDKSPSPGGCAWSILFICAGLLSGLLWLLLPGRPAGASFPVFKEEDTWLEVTISSQMGSLLSEEDNSYSNIETHYTKLGGWFHPDERVQVDSVRVAGILSESEVSFWQQAGDSLAPIHVLLPGRRSVLKFIPPIHFPNAQRPKQAPHRFLRTLQN